MKKTVYVVFAVFFACLGIISAILVDANPYWIIPLVLSVPGFFASLVLFMTSGTKDGDIPFVGY
jgi:hypothetical protein